MTLAVFASNLRTMLVTLPQLVEQRPWLTERWVRSLVAARKVPFHKVSGRLLFDPADFDALAAAGRVEPPPPRPPRPKPRRARR